MRSPESPQRRSGHANARDPPPRQGHGRRYSMNASSDDERRRRKQRSKSRSPRREHKRQRQDRDSRRRSASPGRRRYDERSERRRSPDSHSRLKEDHRPRRISRSRSRDRKHSHRSRSRDRKTRRTEDGYRSRRPEDFQEKARSRSRSRGKTRRRSSSRGAKRHHGSQSPSDNRRRRRNASESQSPRRPPARSPPAIRRNGPLQSQNAAFSAEMAPESDEAPAEKQKPNFSNTGLLAKEANKVAGTSISLKYHEPSEARKPPASAAWAMLCFKESDHLSTVQLYERSCWLIGREMKVADVLIEHPSSSGQHAVIQFRWRERTTETGEKKGRVKPYVIDLESRNGTLLNGEKIEAGRYVELKSGDVLKFGESTREYVLMLPPKE